MTLDTKRLRAWTNLLWRDGVAITHPALRELGADFTDAVDEVERLRLDLATAIKDITARNLAIEWLRAENTGANRVIEAARQAINEDLTEFEHSFDAHLLATALATYDQSRSRRLADPEAGDQAGPTAASLTPEQRDDIYSLAVFARYSSNPRAQEIAARVLPTVTPALSPAESRDSSNPDTSPEESGDAGDSTSESKG